MNRLILLATCVLFAAAARAEVLKVPENRGNPTSRTIELAYVVLPTTSKTPGAPIVYLEGGPGQPATPIARNPRAVAQFDALRAIADVVLFDQRGIGTLACKPAPPPPPAAFSDPQWHPAVAARMRDCAADLRAGGVDLAGYNTRESADDLEDLRKTLGAEKLTLLGFSYGTHLALAAVRRHGPRIERVVLVGTEGPDHTWKLPSSYETHIERLGRLIAADAVVGKDVPDFAGSLRRALAKLEKEPIAVTVRDARTKSDLQIPIGADTLRRILLRDFGDASDLPYFPALVHQLERGDASLLSWFATKRWNQLGTGSAMFYAMDCASGVSAPRRQRILAEAPATLMRNEMNAPYIHVCEAAAIPSLGDDFRAPLISDVPTLFISGTLDANTPPFQAEELRWGFSRAAHVVVENAGHEDMLPEPEVQRTIVDFLAGKDVRGRQIVKAPLRFVPLTTKTRD